MQTILIFSKFSPKCKKLFDLIQQIGIDPSTIQPKISLFCIDNADIRKKVQTSSFEIKTVPTILNLIPGGTVEKFEEEHAFSFIENTLGRARNFIMQQQVAQQTQILAQQQAQEKKIDEEEDIYERPERPKDQPVRNKPKPKPQRKPISDKIPPEIKEESEDDRFRSLEQPKRIRKDETQYEEDPELYGGEPPDIRRSAERVIKSKSKESQGDIYGTSEAARKMQEEREAMVADIMPKRPKQYQRTEIM